MQNARSASAPERQPSAAPTRIMVADDDPTARLLVRATLEAEYGEIAEAEDGAAALQALASRAFALAIVDLDMPVMDGFALIEHLRAREDLAHLPIVVITGRDDVVAIERAFAAGATFFVAKPINWNIFRHQVRYVLRMATVEQTSRQARRQAEEHLELHVNALSVIDHDVRSTLARVRRFAERLNELSAPSGGGPVSAAANGIIDASDGLSSGIDRIEKGTAILSGAMPLRQDETRVADLFADARARLESAGRRDVDRVVVERPPNLLLCCDQDMVAGAVANILENALMFSPEHSTVRLAATATSRGQLRVEVEDQGGGIPDELVDACVRPFNRVARGKAGEGDAHAGLGLAIAKSIVQRHDGHLGIVSEAGRGTEVLMTFPASRVREHPEPAANAVAQMQAHIMARL